MAAGGRREGAGSKKRYTEDLVKISLLVPVSLASEIKDYAKKRKKDFLIKKASS